LSLVRFFYYLMLTAEYLVWTAAYVFQKYQILFRRFKDKSNKKLFRRWDSERELSFRWHRTRTTKYNIDSCINSATGRRSYVLVRRFIKFSKITQCNVHYAVQDHSMSPILVPIESSYTTFVINTNLPLILHRFQVMADYWSNFR